MRIKTQRTNVATGLKRTIRFLSLSLLTVITLTGCVNPLKKYEAALLSSELSEIDRLTVEPLQVGQTRKTRLDSSGPAIAIDGDRSYAKLYRLGDVVKGMSLHIVGDCDCGHAETAVWMLPVVSLLDSQFRVVESASELQIVNRVKSAYWSEQLVAVGLVQVPDTAAYALVHTNKRQRKRGVGMSFSRSQTISLGGTSVNSGTNNYAYVIPASPVGQFEVTLLAPGESSPKGAKFMQAPFGEIVEK
jgi:hypothetical protein